ncbi:DNA/RNA helicase [Loigolactobacillus backii]|uniref:DEAD/DEAH box helicase n=1 Tax=Loigolactobacillus backii TaxID=375175 RepID=UPI000C1C9618|nr:DEAD/DEAH box helicase [Loigolactobacillus backii]PIO83906.1 DNA/RNA helicase [Loigolactobacillus backii]
MNCEALFGRLEIVDQTTSKAWQDLFPGLIVQPAMSLTNTVVTCRRCQARYSKKSVQLPSGTYYCPTCLLLGRVCSNEYLVSLPEKNHFTGPTELTWRGTLTPAQTEAAEMIKQIFKQHRQHLLWAVTGAGKTEMLFPGLFAALSQGKRVAIASPRIDVCLELLPRLQQAFAQTEIMLLYGDQPEPYHYTQFVLCTTHQLLRFYQAFDVLVIDEVDAFPFAQDQQLHFAVQQARKTISACLYLTATPGPALLQQVRKGVLSLSYLPRRYHGHPLALPHCHLALNWYKQLMKGRLPSVLNRLLKDKVQRQQSFLLFVPKIALLKPLAKLLSNNFANLKFTTVYAADPKRAEKVQAMRQEKLTALLTTTILERGVTFKNIEVIVLGSDDSVFTTSALVQMAGRVGRHRDYPTGRVDFICAGYSCAMKQATKQIKQINQKAGF